MGQPAYVMAFRKRIYNKGYRDISIKKVKGRDGLELWQVQAKDPVFDVRFSKVMSANLLANLPRNKK